MVSRGARAAGIAAALVLGSAALGQPAPVWSIGQPDRDYCELAIAGRYDLYPRHFPQDVTFVVGRSDPAVDWPYVQPGPLDAWAGGRAHPFRVRFTLSGQPAPVYRLEIALVNTHYASAPALRVAVNGRARYALPLPLGGPDASLTDASAGKPHVERLLFPGRHLRAGENEIALTVTTGSWLLYDALRLEAAPDVPARPRITAVSAASTPLFRRVGGALRQAVAVQVRNAGVEGEAVMRLDGDQGAPVRVQVGPGPGTHYLLVAPFGAAARRTVRVSAADETQEAAFDARPSRRWRVYVAPCAHTDIGYTDLQERAIDRHRDNTMLALDACAKDPAFRWNLEVAAHAWFVKDRSPERYGELLQRLREGRIGVQGLYLNMLTGLCSGEELVEALARARRLGRASGFDVRSAHLTDVPSAVGTLPTLLAGAGYRYFSDAVNEYRGPAFRGEGGSRRQSPFWWEGPDGSRVLAIFTTGYAQASGLGLTQSVSEVARLLPGWLQAYERPTYPGDAVFVYGAFSDNAVMSPAYAAVAEKWNRTWEFPRIVVSRSDAFFRYVDERFGRLLPVVRGDMGVFWEDGAGSSAYETALTRWARARTDGAAALLAASSGGTPPAAAAEVRAAREATLFYDEHTWGAWCSISDPHGQQTVEQWERKAAFAVQAAARADRAAALARRAIAGSAPPEPSRWSVVNELGWARDVAASVAAPAGPGPWRVVDVETGRAVPCQPSGGRIVFTAARVPPFGARRFRLARGAAATGPVAVVSEDGVTIRTSGVRLRLDAATGGIASLRVAGVAGELAAGGGYSLNQFIYVSGGEGSSIVQPGARPPELTLRTHTRAAVRVLENGPARAVIAVERRGDGVPDVDSYLVLGRSAQVDIINILRKEPTLAKEAGYFAFPFALKASAARAFVDVPYGVVEAGRDQLPGACREWFCANGAAAVTDGATTCLLATPHAPLLTVGDVFRGDWSGVAPRANGAVFSYVLNNYWDTNYRAEQGGAMLFAYRLAARPGAVRPAEVIRFGREALCAAPDPRLAASGSAGVRRGALLPDERQACVAGVAGGLAPAPTVAAGTAYLAALTNADGGLRARLHNAGSAPTTAVLRYRAPGRSPWLADLSGQLLGRLATGSDGTVRVPVRARGLATVVWRPMRETARAPVSGAGAPASHRPGYPPGPE
ncbi:MAG: hypothetical protein IT208_02090 [Chthonomonadales bacterium]|nr:hypothetical protein [Chthonomonadales bacterium]